MTSSLSAVAAVPPAEVALALLFPPALPGCNSCSFAAVAAARLLNSTGSSSISSEEAMLLTCTLTLLRYALYAKWLNVKFASW